MSNEKKFVYTDNYNIAKESVFTNVKRIYREEGVKVLVKKIFSYIGFQMNLLFSYIGFRINYTLFNKYFDVNKKKYKYFINWYNAVTGERVVEIPFSMDFIDKYHGKKILEVGNVLSHYYKFEHIVVDKYEKNKNVINKDILNFSPNEKYDLIISVSTVEHIGFDELIRERKREKPLKAILKMINLLAENGILLITVPLRYNTEIDEIIKNNSISFNQKYFLKRVSVYNLWKETTFEDACNYKYNSKYPFTPHANSLAILIYKKI